MEEVQPLAQILQFFRRLADNLALIPVALRAIRLGGQGFAGVWGAFPPPAENADED